MLLSNVIDKFLDKDSLTDTGTAEESDLTSLKVWFKKVDHLDSCKKNLLRCCKILEFWRLAMDRERILTVQGCHSINGISGHIHDSTPDLSTDRHGNRRTGTYRLKTSSKAICRIHRHCSYCIFSNMLLYLYNQKSSVFASDCQSFMNSRKLTMSIICQLKMHIDHGADNLGNLSF